MPTWEIHCWKRGGKPFIKLLGGEYFWGPCEFGSWASASEERAREGDNMRGYDSLFGGLRLWRDLIEPGGRNC